MSPVPATVNRISQIGLEETPGNSVAAHRRITSFTFELGGSMEIQDFTPQGQKFASGYILNQEWSEGSYDGVLAYDDVVYPVSSAFQNSVPTRVLAGETWTANTQRKVGDYIAPNPRNGRVYRVSSAGGSTVTGAAGTSGATQPVWPTTDGSTVNDGALILTEAEVDNDVDAFEWVFDISDLGREEIATYTIETGDAVLGDADRAAYAHFSSFSISSARAGDFTCSGDFIAKKLEPMVLTSTGIDESPLRPASSAGVTVFCDDSPAEFGQTKFTTAFSFEEELSDRYGQAWFLDRDMESFATHFETTPGLSISMTVADDEKVDDFVQALRVGQSKYIRFDSMGPEIAKGVKYRLLWDTSCMVNDAPDPGDEDGARSAELSFGAHRSPEWGRTTRLRVINTIESLAPTP